MSLEIVLEHRNGLIALDIFSAYGQLKLLLYDLLNYSRVTSQSTFLLELLHKDLDQIKTCKSTGSVENVFVPNDKEIQFEQKMTLK